MSCVPEVWIGCERVTNYGCDFVVAVVVVEGVDNNENAEELGVHCEHEDWI